MTEASKKYNAQYTLRVDEQYASRGSGVRTQDKYRSEFMRDRDRILYSKAFRRLAGKTQVFITGVDDHMRTRLTHTLEVSQIARAIAKPLNLDVDLVEAIALGHDLGHTPFGHAGERILHEIMTPQEEHPLGDDCVLSRKRWQGGFPAAFDELLGFKHNLQSLVVAASLEKNYGELGLDLTNYTLCGMKDHSSARYKPGKVSNHDSLGYYTPYINRFCRLPGGQEAWSLEALLVAEADEIAQRHHDVEDALIGGILSPQELVELMEKHLPEEMAALRLTRAERNMLEKPSKYSLAQFNALISRILVNLMVTTLTETAAYQLNRFAAEETVAVGGVERPISYKTIHDYRLRNLPDAHRMQLIFSYSRCSDVKELEGGFQERIKGLTSAISKRLLGSPQIKNADREGQQIITDLFRAYYADPRYLPNHCVFEFLGEFHRMRQLPQLAPWFRGKVRLSPEKKLREKATQKGMGPVRSTFTRIISNRKAMLPGEELLLMRTICNHIACMTDDYARQTLRELQKSGAARP